MDQELNMEEGELIESDMELEENEGFNENYSMFVDDQGVHLGSLGGFQCIAAAGKYIGNSLLGYAAMVDFAHVQDACGLKEDFKHVVLDSWKVAVARNPLYALASMLKRLKHALRFWSMESFGNIFHNSKHSEDQVLQKEMVFEQDKSSTARSDLHEVQA
ncbi:hypothetical protein ACH5RR_029688 [Cinchona calisaya]|uniref:Uncharacterized protein n=1 Tax=Cinchona calisaya TaxID=153742 RepID=A0ABD2YWR9_9GENT